MRWITAGCAAQPGTSILPSPPAVDPGLTDDERRASSSWPGHSYKCDAERDGKRASRFPARCDGHFRVRSRARLATVRPLSSPEFKRPGLVWRTEELRNG